MRTAAEESGPQDYNFSSTGYEPNDYFLTETFVEFNQESVTELGLRRRRYRSNALQRVPKTSRSLSRRRPVVQSVVVVNETVVNRDKSHDSENEQIRTLLDRQREQILADRQAEIGKHEFQADYDRRSKQKISETIESQQEELHRAQAEERR